jgi:pimeloyl-ACP methyl ester carboxylesterase
MAGGSRASVVGEGRALAEFVQLFADPLYYGVGAPRGDGRLALVLPGLFANDWYLWPLRSWLARVGFRPVRSTLAINAGCPERLSREVEEELARRRRRAPGPVILIGHSRGGILARAIAARLQDQASHLILLGSPVSLLLRTEQWSSSAVAQAPAASRVAEAGIRARRALDPDCDVPACGCPFPADFARALSKQTKVVSIYSRDDPVVPPWAAPVPGAENVEVSGTHSGLAYNRATYRTLANVLKVPAAGWPTSR